MAKENNIFSLINQILYKKSNIPYEKRLGSAYMLLLWFSHEKNLLPLCNKLNKYLFEWNDKKIYDALFYSVPKGPRFLRWIKKDKINEDHIKEIAEKYNISKREAMIYADTVR